VNTMIAGHPVTIREWQGPVGQWDSRLKETRQLREVSVAPMTRGQSWTADAINQDLVVQYDVGTGAVKGIEQIRRGFVKRDEIAWVGSHRHDPNGNQPYIASYFFCMQLTCRLALASYVFQTTAASGLLPSRHYANNFTYGPRLTCTHQICRPGKATSVVVQSPS